MNIRPAFHVALSVCCLVTGSTNYARAQDFSALPSQKLHCSGASATAASSDSESGSAAKVFGTMTSIDVADGAVTDEATATTDSAYATDSAHEAGLAQDDTATAEPMAKGAPKKLIAVNNWAESKSADESDLPVVTARIDSLANQALQDEVELLILNTRFRMSTTDKSRIKPWRVFVYNLAGSGVATAGITTIAAERWRTWQRPATANRGALKAGPILLLTSHSIMTGGVLIEALLDAVNDCKLRKRGLDAKATQKRAMELCVAIDRTLAEREQLLARTSSLPESERQMLAAEGVVLKDFRNMALAEYIQFHVRAKRRLGARNVSYLNQLSAATTGGYMGSLCGLLAVADRNPRLAGPAGIGFTISGANIVTGPIIGRIAGNYAAKRAKTRLDRECGKIGPVQLSEHISVLKGMLTAHDERLAARVSAYETADLVFKQQSQMNAAEKKKADKEFLERCLFNASIGGTKMAWGIQLTNAGYGFKQPAPTPPAPRAAAGPSASSSRLPVKRPKTAAQLFAKRVAQGSTSYIPGTGVWILDTLQARLRGELDVYSLGSQSALPHQKLKNREAKLLELGESVRQLSP